MGQALVVGLRDGLPDDLRDDFRSTGASHLLAISGLHLAVVLGMSLAVSRRLLGKRSQFYLLAPLALMWIYALVSGMSPSVTRAAIMGSIYLAAISVGRPRSALPALALAAALMVLVNTGALWSISFQLSFAAMAGIALLAEPLAARIRPALAGVPGPAALPESLQAPISIMVALTMAATVATLPLVGFYFQQVSLVSVPVTLLALPALPAILLTQGAAALVGLANEGLAQPVGWLAWVLTSYLTELVRGIAAIPGTSLRIGELPTWPVWAYYGLLALLLPGGPGLRRVLRTGREALTSPPSVPLLGSRGVPLLVVALVGAIAALVWIAALSERDSKLSVAFIDVGQGDAIFISTPGGHQVLIDGGSDPLEAVQFLGERMGFGDRSLDLVVLTHPHNDHVNGLLEVLARYEVGNVLERQAAHDAAPYLAWRQAVTDEGARVIQAEAGQVLVFDDGVYLEVLGPPDRLLCGTSSEVNDASVVLKVVYGEVSFLLPGDASAAAESAIATRSASLDSDVLKAAHHGSRTSSSPAFLDAVSPAVAIISVGQDNRFGHPHPEALDTLLRHVSPDMLFTTRDRGTIEFVTDGQTLTLKTER